jgi:autotransporter-associated beta strand protein
MKPKFIALPRNLILTSSAMMAVLAPLNALAADFTWGGATDSTWTTNTNWTTGTAPTYGTSYLADTLRISNGAASSAVYDPVSASAPSLTTTFGAGRAFVLGSTTAGSLTVSSGTLSFARSTNTGSEPIMANGANASLLINGGALDLTAHLNTFLFLNGGTANTSDLTISSGSFSSNGFNLQQSGTGVGTINLDGGTMAVTVFTRPAATGSTTFNIDGGTLRARATSASFLPALTGLQTIVEDGGAVIDTNGFNVTIAEVLEHDTTLGLSPDGGLIKNGVGFLSLTGANTFTGPVTINAGTALATSSRIQLLSSNTGAGTGTVTLAGSFTEIQVANGRNIANPIIISNTGDTKELFLPSPGGGAFAAATFSGPITIDETSIDNFRVRADDNNFLTFSGVVSGPGGIYKYQPGRLNLTNAANAFEGDIKIAHGEVSFTTGALGTTGQIRMEGTAVVGGVSLRWDPTNDQDISSRLVMYAGKNATFNLAEQASPFDVANVTFLNAIGNGTTAAMTKTGPGTLTLTQPSTYTGGTTLTQGTLEFTNGGLGTTGSVTMNGAILRWGTGNTEDISSRIVMVNARSATFSTNGNDVSFASAIGSSTTGSFTKSTTAGTLTLNGTNTYTGSTTIGGGTLKLGASASIASSASVTVAAGATLDTSDQATYSVPATQPLTFAINANAGGSSGKIAAAGLDVSSAVVTYSITGTPDDPVYVLATYTGTLAGTFSSVPTPPTGYTLKYDHEGNKIALVQAAANDYAAWAGSQVPVVTGGPNGDSDNDGVKNLIEYALIDGGEHGSLTGTTITFTKRPAPYGGDITYDIESSSLLTPGSWTTLAKPPVAESTGSISYTFSPGSPEKNFFRLKVVKVP